MGKFIISEVAWARSLFHDPREIVQFKWRADEITERTALFSQGKKKSSLHGPFVVATFHLLADVRVLNTLWESRNG